MDKQDLAYELVYNDVPLRNVWCFFMYLNPDPCYGVPYVGCAY
jgi:hypothetical protein